MNALTFPEVLDNTIMTTFRKCERKFYWSQVRTLALTDQNVHLISGAAFAKGLEVCRKSFFLKGLSFEESLIRGAAALVAAYGDYTPSDKNSNKSLPNILGALEFYFNKWPITERVPYEFGGRPAIEFSFALPIPGCYHPETGKEMIYCGRYDLITKLNDVVMGEDDKTTSQLGDSWFAKWRLGSQITGYTWGAQEYGIPIRGFILRGISLLKRSYGDSEAIVYRSDTKIREFKENLVLTFHKMVAAWKSGQYQLNMDDACSSYGGCPYLELCESDYPEQWIEGRYVLHKWEPLRSRD